ncbi:hypothetical protein FE783_14160 [Paenibacillus mesophilus]|uniref:hypothetical protein n=1 Tax=Paenibacillus mesophilus TaxID=2582849 RepID=UPI00110D962D|nr:hypothetical protein [Paenibacillus mesophilus]TMV49634.1 hypothetical protein FE783_14160 [Paenibacillus mesophilus]
MSESRSATNRPDMPGPSGKYKPTTRLLVIEQGLDFLSGIGSEHICGVCIDNGGSCCKGCRNLTAGTGCSLRNTSCTAWLCGFLRYFLYETGLLKEWENFWKQVPGLDYREDFTPDHFTVRKTLSNPNLRFLGFELAEDLRALAESKSKQGYIINLREQIDRSLDELSIWKTASKQAIARKNIQVLSKPFRRFHQALEHYRSDLST